MANDERIVCCGDCRRQRRQRWSFGQLQDLRRPWSCSSCCCRHARWSRRSGRYAYGLGTLLAEETAQCGRRTCGQGHASTPNARLSTRHSSALASHHSIASAVRGCGMLRLLWLLQLLANYCGCWRGCCGCRGWNVIQLSHCFLYCPLELRVQFAAPLWVGWLLGWWYMVFGCGVCVRRSCVCVWCVLERFSVGGLGIRVDSDHDDDDDVAHIGLYTHTYMHTHTHTYLVLFFSA